MPVHPFGRPVASNRPVTDDRTDLELVIAASGGDRGSFAVLLKRYCPRLLALARHIVGPDTAEDVMQEAAVDAYRSLDGFAGRSAVGTWLYRITLNRCLAERRKRRPEPVEAEPLDLLRRWEDPDYTADPAVVAARRATPMSCEPFSTRSPRPTGWRSSSTTPRACPPSALAEAMDIPLGTAKSHIGRGRMSLVSRLAEDDRGLLEGVR